MYVYNKFDRNDDTVIVVVDRSINDVYVCNCGCTMINQS